MPKTDTTRLCIVTRQILPKADLLRIVRQKSGDVVVDIDQNISGRGMYVQKKAPVIAALFSEKKKGLWKHALKCEISSEQKQKLQQHILQLDITDN